MKEIESLIEISSLDGVSGYERNVARYLENNLKDLGLTIVHDALGNLIVTKKSKAKDASSIAFFAHMDEVGYIVSYINDDGTITGYVIGGINSAILPSTRMKLTTSSGKTYSGMIQATPPHLLSEGSKTELKPNDFIFDFGFSSKQEVLDSGISVGDMMTFEVENKVIANGKRIMGKAMDDRVGVTALYELAKFISSQEYDYDISIVFTTQEEVGTRGATVASYRVKPDIAVVIDVSPVMKQYGHLGKGVLIRHSDRTMIGFTDLINYQIELMEKNDIKYQHYFSLGGTDAGAIHISQDGIKTLTMCLVSESIHSPSSILDLDDYVSLLKALKVLVGDLNSSKITKLKG